MSNAVVALLWFWAVVILALVGPYAWIHWQKWRAERCKQMEYRRHCRLVKKWTGWYLSFNKRYYFFVHYLNAAGNLKSLPLDDFLNLKLPADEAPAVWIVRQSENDAPHGNYVSKEDLALVWRDEDDQSAKWHIGPVKYPTISEYPAPALSFRLLDRDDKIIGLRMPLSEEEPYELLLKKTLELVSASPGIRDVNSVWIDIAQKKIPPMLLATKDAMGGSPVLESVRRFVEKGPAELAHNADPPIC